MGASISNLIDDLYAMGVREGGVLLVHASLRSIGRLEGGAEAIIQALLEVLGNEGTLLLPALSYETVTAEHPHFDVLQTPCCVGALPEYFRQRAGTLRSIHPTHSVCGIGAQARELLSGHEADTTPCGTHSPFHRLRDEAGQILFLGCGLRPNTSMHGIEELSEPSYLYDSVITYTIKDSKGNLSKMAVRRHNFEGWIQRYDRLEQVLGEDALQKGKVSDAECHLIEVATMWTVAHQKLTENPFFFVDAENSEHL